MQVKRELKLSVFADDNIMLIGNLINIQTIIISEYDKVIE